MENSIIQTRKELIVSLQADSEPCLKLARFLKPSLLASNITDPPKAPQPASSITFARNEHDDEPLLAVQLKGWHSPQVNYKSWVVSMSAKHKHVWKKAGIYDAVMNSTHKIKRFDDLVLGFVSNWCSKTKSFVFEWGECSITLEDVHVLGGYSLLGDSVFSPVENHSHQLIIDSLLDIRLQLSKTSAKKPTHQLWLKTFMDVNHRYEHEAFLAYWLSMFVFPQAKDTIGKLVIPISVRLANGERISLAPAVLASIYIDLGHIAKKKHHGDTKAPHVWAPFQLVQIWIWERFVHLRPKLYTLKPVEPRMARWVIDDKAEVENVKLSRLDWNSMGNDFQWRPYASNVNNNILFNNFYGDKIACGGNDDELQSFARCLRCCEIAGIDCIEQYLPHRVAMQFGFDQDIPPNVRKSSDSPQVAWENYSKHIDVTDLCIPSPDVIPGVTARYLKWRNDKFVRIVNAKGGKTSRTSKTKKIMRHGKNEADTGSQVLNQHKTPSEDDTDSTIPDVPPGFEPKTLQLKKEESPISGMNKLAGRRRKWNDDLTLAEVIVRGQRFEDNGLSDNCDDEDEDFMPLRKLLGKHKLSIVKLVSQGSPSPPADATFQISKNGKVVAELDSSMEMKEAYNQEGETDICTTTDKHVSEGFADFNTNEASFNEQQCSLKESIIAVDAYEKHDTVCHDEKEKPWMGVERSIEMLARQIEILKADARARGHNIS